TPQGRRARRSREPKLRVTHARRYEHSARGCSDASDRVVLHAVERDALAAGDVSELLWIQHADDRLALRLLGLGGALEDLHAVRRSGSSVVATILKSAWRRGVATPGRFDYIAVARTIAIAWTRATRARVYVRRLRLPRDVHGHRLERGLG